MGSLRRQAWPAYFSPHQQSEPAASEPPAASSPPAFCSWLEVPIHGSKGSQNEWTVALALIFQSIHNEGHLEQGRGKSVSPYSGLLRIKVTPEEPLPSSVLPIVSSKETRQQKMSTRLNFSLSGKQQIYTCLEKLSLEKDWNSLALSKN